MYIKTHRVLAGVSFLLFFGLAAMMENAGSLEQLLRLFAGSMAALLSFAWNASEGGLYDYDPWEDER